MPLTWRETEAVARALHEALPEAEPLDLPDDTLRAHAGALPMGVAAAAQTLDRDTLRAIRMLWYELSQAEAGDVSG